MQMQPELRPIAPQHEICLPCLPGIRTSRVDGALTRDIQKALNTNVVLSCRNPPHSVERLRGCPKHSSLPGETAYCKCELIAHMQTLYSFADRTFVGWLNRS